MTCDERGATICVSPSSPGAVTAGPGVFDTFESRVADAVRGYLDRAGLENWHSAEEIMAGVLVALDIAAPRQEDRARLLHLVTRAACREVDEGRAVEMPRQAHNPRQPRCWGALSPEDRAGAAATRSADATRARREALLARLVEAMHALAALDGAPLERAAVAVEVLRGRTLLTGELSPGRDDLHWEGGRIRRVDAIGLLRAAADAWPPDSEIDIRLNATACDTERLGRLHDWPHYRWLARQCPRGRRAERRAYLFVSRVLYLMDGPTG